MVKLIGFELKKMFSHRYLIPVWLLLFGLSFITNFIMYGYNEQYVKSEREFYSKYGGVLTEQKHMAIAKMADNWEPFNNNEGEFRKEWIIADDAMHDISYMISYRDLRERIINQAQENAELYGEKGYVYLDRLNRQILKKYKSYTQPMLISSSDFRWFLGDNMYVAFAMLMIMILTANIFTREWESKMNSVLCSSYAGKSKVFLSKIGASAAGSFGVMLAFIFVKHLVGMYTLCLYGWRAPIGSIERFAYTTLDMDIWQADSLFILLTCTAAMLFGILFSALSSFCKRSFVSTVISFLILTAGYLGFFVLRYFNNMLYHIDFESERIKRFLDMLRSFVFTLLLEPQEYFYNYYTVSIFGYPVPTVISSLVIGGMSVGLVTVIAYALYIGGIIRKKG